MFHFFSIYQVFELYELVSNYGTNEVRTTFDTRKKNVYKDTIMYLQFFFVIKMLIFRLKSILRSTFSKVCTPDPNLRCDNNTFIIPLLDSFGEDFFLCRKKRLKALQLRVIIL